MLDQVYLWWLITLMMIWLVFGADLMVLWLANCRALFYRNTHGPIISLQKQSKKPFYKQLINLKRSVFCWLNRFLYLWASVKFQYCQQARKPPGSYTNVFIVFRSVYRKSGAYPTTQSTTVCTTHFIGWRHLWIATSSIIEQLLSCGCRWVWLWLISHWFPSAAQSMLIGWLTTPRTSRINTRRYWRSRRLLLVGRWFFSIVSFSSVRIPCRP